MLIKELNSYRYRKFKKKEKSDFEPFKSREKCEIMIKVLRGLIDLELLMEQNVIINHFFLHNLRGI